MEWYSPSQEPGEAWSLPKVFSPRENTCWVKSRQTYMAVIIEIVFFFLTGILDLLTFFFSLEFSQFSDHSGFVLKTSSSSFHICDNMHSLVITIKGPNCTQTLLAYGYLEFQSTLLLRSFWHSRRSFSLISPWCLSLSYLVRSLCEMLFYTKHLDGFTTRMFPLI